MKQMKTVFWMMTLLLSSVLVTSCDYGGDPKPRKTLLEKHQQNLKMIDVMGHQLTYLDYASSREKVMILLHGIPTSSLLYRNIAKGLATQTDFRVIALDMLGFGESDKPNTPESYTFESQSKRVHAFADALGIDNFVLGVHDTGGTIGWQMMLQERWDRVEGLLVTNTTLEFDGFTPPTPMVPIFEGIMTPREAWNTLLADEETALQTVRTFLTEGMYDQTKVTDELVTAYAKAATQPEAFINFFETFGFILDRLDEVKAQMKAFDKPLMLLWGGKDPFLDVNIVPYKLKEDFGASDDQLQILNNAGHYLQEDEPQKYVKVVAEFLNTQF